MERPSKEDLRLALHMVDDSSFLVGQWLKAEVLAQRDEVGLAKNLRAKSLAQIDAIRALLTAGPGSEARAGNDPGLIDVADGSVADGAEVADEEWRVAIRKALGE